MHPNNRIRSTTTSGDSFRALTIQQVWNKGKIVAGKNPDSWRRDQYGDLIQRSAYGDTTNKYGWEIDHITPVGGHGTDEVNNLQPLQWENNLLKEEYMLYMLSKVA